MTGWLGRVWAIARMTVIEASRRSVFWVLVLFAIWLLYSLTELPGHKPDDRLRVLQSWSAQTITLFTTLVALFTVGFSLPTDFEEKRVYVLVSKPIEKVTLFLGRYLGFTLVLALLLLFMGLASVVYIRVVQWTGGPDFPAPVARPRIVVPEAGFVHSGARPSRVVPGHLYVDRVTDGSLTWQFEGLRPEDFPKETTAVAILVLQSSDPGDTYRVTGNVVFQISSDKGTREKGMFAQSNEELNLPFPSDLIDDRGRLRIRVAPADADGRVRAGRDSVVLYGRPGSFELNFLRGMILSLLQAMLILTITLSASTFLSAPTSILTGLILFLVGLSHGWISEGVKDIKGAMEIREQDPHRHESPDDLPAPLMAVSGWLSERILVAVPDFDRFDFSTWMLKDRAIPWSVVAVRTGYALVPISIMALIGMLVIHFRALG